MQAASSVHRKLEQLKASPPDSRIRQVRGRTALELAEVKDFTLDVDIRAWRAHTGLSEYDIYWDVRPGSADMS